MKRPFDIGGSEDFGAIDMNEDGPPFHHEWEARVFAINAILLTRGTYNLDEFRYAVERTSRQDHFELSYYERWLRAIETLLEEKGVLGRGV